MKCHAKLKSGEMCGARAASVIRHYPVCDRVAHYYGRCEMFEMTTETTYPDNLEKTLAVVDFLAGDSVERIAKKRSMRVIDVEMAIRLIR
jgi:hypothetical protein